MVNFQSDDWAFVKSRVEELLKVQRAFLENPNQTFREMILCKGEIRALKRVLNLPQDSYEVSAANKR